MNPSYATDSQLLDDYVLAFEDAFSKEQATPLHQFLPDRSHPIYKTVLKELIRVDMELRWGAGNPRPLQDYRGEFPELFQDAECLKEIAFEEYRLKVQAGETPSAQEYHNRFGIDTGLLDYPQTVINTDAEIDLDSDQIRSEAEEVRKGEEDAQFDAMSRIVGGRTGEMLREIYTSSPQKAKRLIKDFSRMPEVGETFAGFELVEELGRGAFGRVFLGRQEALAHRQVALKVAPDVWKETQQLAQLQHTNIVPIYSVHQTNHLQAVCMPFLGTHTLTDLYRQISTSNVLPDSGANLFAGWNEATVIGVEGETSAPQEKPAQNEQPTTFLEKLQSLDYISAILTLGLGMADGLAHAHERGIYHRDLKPANVLLTDEGQPLLLDFNLSEDTKLRDNATAAIIGGTLPYMAPEQMRAFAGEQQQVDGRGDIYALGLMLYELLTNRSPFPTKSKVLNQLPTRERLFLMLSERSKPIIPARKHNAQIPSSVEAILNKCLAANPQDRYRTARELHSDLDRHLQDLPLKYTPEPSFREKATKWLRRNPKLPYRLLALTIPFVLVLVAVLGIRSYHLEQDRIAEERLNTFRTTAQQAKFQFNTQMGDPQARKAGIEKAMAALNLYRAQNDPNWTEDSQLDYLSADQRNNLFNEVGEMYYFLAQAYAETQSGEALQEALKFNEKAQRLFDRTKQAPPSLWAQRIDLRKQLGETEQAAKAIRELKPKPLLTTRDYYLAGRDEEDHGRFDKALKLYEKATVVDPRNFWAWFYLASACDNKGADEAAYNHYSRCIALEPKLSYLRFKRGIALLRQRKYRTARADFDKAIAMDPTFEEAYFNRGLAHMKLQNYREAVIDFTYFIEHKPKVTRAYFMRAKAHKQLKDEKSYRADIQQAMSREPGDANSWNARGFFRMETEPEKAIEDFDRALKMKPFFRQALKSKAYVLSEKLGKTKEAISVLDKIIKVYPEYLVARTTRGVLYARLGDVKAARSDAAFSMRALANNSNPEVRYQVGCIHSLLSKKYPGDRKLAILSLRKALEGKFGAKLLPVDRDLDPIRETPEFQGLLKTYSIRRTKKL